MFRWQADSGHFYMHAGLNEPAIPIKSEPSHHAVSSESSLFTNTKKKIDKKIKGQAKIETSSLIQKDFYGCAQV